ncbi:hypothetical protein SB778_40405, partial [Paraburkholderia sp. SIMBA_050]
MTTGFDSTTAVRRWLSRTRYALTSTRLSGGGPAANGAFAAAMTVRSPPVEARAAIFGQFRPLDSLAWIIDNRYK